MIRVYKAAANERRETVEFVGEREKEEREVAAA